jgi:hypothetical protein
MDFRMGRGDGRGMSGIANKLDRAESRRQRRYSTPVFDVIVECELFRSVDWSAGGVHLDGACEGVPVGSSVDGWLALPDLPKAYAFSGEILRTDPATGNTVLRFDDVEAETADFLDRAVAWRLH